MLKIQLINRNWFESQRKILATIVPRPALGRTLPPIQCVPGAFFVEVKRLEREAEHYPCTAAVKEFGVMASRRCVFIT
jgi:hypothetical protein